jgi:phage tail-like protein
MPERGKPLRLAFDAKQPKALTEAAEKIAAEGGGLRVLLDGATADEGVQLAATLAKQASLEVERIDLSQVISSYIGETEKNLTAIFAKADAKTQLLFFDEADALFGRRTEVADAHDRYANLETSYLRALAKFRGTAVIAVAAPAENYAGLLRASDLLVEFRTAAPLPERPAAVAWAAPHSNLHFRVFVGDLELGLCAVSGLGDESEIVRVRDGGSPRDVRAVPGPTQTDILLLRRAVTRSKDLYHWRRAIVDGKDDRRSIEIWQIEAAGGQPVNRWRLTGCWPRRWRGPDFDALLGGVAGEEVEICYDRFDWL